MVPIIPAGGVGEPGPQHRNCRLGAHFAAQSRLQLGRGGECPGWLLAPLVQAAGSRHSLPPDPMLTSASKAGLQGWLK